MADLADLIRHDAPRRYGAGAHYPFKFLLEKKYRFTSRFGEEVLLHRRHEDDIILPRALCPVGPNDERTKGLPAAYPSKPSPKPHQEAVFADTFAFLDQGLSGLVCAYTGWGKTVLGYAAAAHLGRKTLVITTKDDIYRQWIGGACGTEGQPNFLGLKRSQVGEIRGDKMQVEGREFVVAMIHSLSKGRLPPEWADQFGLVIFDECHRVPADSFSAVADMFRAHWRLGLSATIERADGKDLMLQAHIGPVRAATEAQLMIPKVLRFTSNWSCPRVSKIVEGEKTVVRLPHTPGKTTHIEGIMQEDKNRNLMLGELMLTAYQRERQCVVFANQHAHLHELTRTAVKMGVSGRDIGLYIGATTKPEKAARDAASVKRLVLTTYGMMGEGTNLPWLDCCILAIPRSHVEQPVGRIRREYPDKPPPTVMDLVDLDSPVFAGYAASRLRWYQSIGAVVKQMN